MSFWRAIDWQCPWLAPYRAHGESACARLDAGATVAEALNHVAAGSPPQLQAGPVQFVHQGALPPGVAYEAFIHRRACVPTRDNLHDLFNGLVWLAYPGLKRRLNELQAEQIAQAGIGSTRGAVRDALTLHDENGAWWAAPPRLAQALAARDWTALFITHRADWAATPPVLFGHALLEKLVQPRKPITAHVCLLPAGAEAPSQLARLLTPATLAAKPFHPLPALGVPLWWPANTDPAFYDDASVFRPKQRDPA